MDLGHSLTLSGLTYPEAASEVCHDSFYQSGSSAGPDAKWSNPAAGLTLLWPVTIQGKF